HRISGNVEHNWNRCGRSLSRDCSRNGACDDHRHLTTHQLRRHLWQSIVLALGPAVFDRHIAPLHIAGFGQAPAEYRYPWRARPWRKRIEIANHRHRLLRARRERPRDSRAAEKREELAPPHSITSSASESRLSEILTPSAFAVLRLITSSNFVGCSTGRSAGFSPLRIRAV